MISNLYGSATTAVASVSVSARSPVLRYPLVFCAGPREGASIITALFEIKQDQIRVWLQFDFRFKLAGVRA